MKLKTLAVATLAAIYSLSAQATTVLYKNFEELVDDSDYIVGGTVAETKSTKHQNGEIFTVVTLQESFLVSEAGTDNANKPVKIRFKGGSVPVLDDNGESVGVEGVHAHGAPEFELGQKVILFVSNNGVADMPIYGWKQGLFYVNENDEITDADGLPVVGFDGANIVRGTANGPVSAGKPPSKKRDPTGIPKIIDSDGGIDTILPNANASDVAKEKVANAVPVHVTNFLSMIQERRAIARNDKGVPPKNPNELFELPAIDFANANKHVKFDDDLGTPNAPISAQPEPPKSRPIPTDGGE